MLPAVGPVLHCFHDALDTTFGARIERVALFGSRARGDNRPDSDYDLAAFLRDYGKFGDELKPIVDIETAILFKTGAVITAMRIS